MRQAQVKAQLVEVGVGGLQMGEPHPPAVGIGQVERLLEIQRASSSRLIIFISP